MTYQAIPRSGAGLWDTTDDGTDYTAELANPNNTAGADAIIRAEVGGTSAGDAVFQAAISGGAEWSWGLDNSDADNFGLYSGSALGTGVPALLVSTNHAVVGTVLQDVSGTAGKISLISAVGTKVQFTTQEHILIDSVNITFTTNNTAKGLFNTTGLSMSSRLREAKGADVASGTTITIGNDGNVVAITGTTTINHLTTTDWTAGSVVILLFGTSLTVTHNAGSPPANTAPILLAGAANFSATANDVLTLVYDGTNWRESARTVI